MAAMESGHCFPFIFHFCLLLSRPGLAEQVAWADGGSWPLLSLFSRSLGGAALSGPLWLVLALLFHDCLRN